MGKREKIQAAGAYQGASATDLTVGRPWTPREWKKKAFPRQNSGHHHEASRRRRALTWSSARASEEPRGGAATSYHLPIVLHRVAAATISVGRGMEKE